MNTPNRSPVRRYYPDLPRPTRRLRTPMRPPVPCQILDETGNIAYSPDNKCQVAFSSNMPPDSIVTFPSRTQAKKALWHILQKPESRFFRPPYEVVRVKP